MAAINADTFGPHLSPWRLPLLYAQGQALKLTIRRLSEPPGARHGVIEGEGAPLRVLAWGDSAAVGVGAASQDRALAGCLAQALAVRTGQPVHWQAIGRSGLTAAQCRDELDGLLQALDGGGSTVDLIATSLGGNDVVRLSGSEDFREAMTSVIAALRQRLSPGGRIVLGRAPPFHRSTLFKPPLRDLVQWRVERINALLASVAADYSDVQLAPEAQQVPEGAFATDGFHPSESTYLAWGQLVVDLGYGPD